jgi:hypothetical protein
LSAILVDHPNAHIIVLDPHNEYASAFGERAELFSVDNLQLPLWLLDFEEAVGVLVRSGTSQEKPNFWRRGSDVGGSKGANSSRDRDLIFA